jgi:hypothetical protein
MDVEAKMPKTEIKKNENDKNDFWNVKLNFKKLD